MCFKFHPIGIPDMSGSRDVFCAFVCYIKGNTATRGNVRINVTPRSVRVIVVAKKKKCYIF